MPSEFDLMVGRVAGAVFSEISREYPFPPLMLIPAITYKVRSALTHCRGIGTTSPEERKELAEEIRTSLTPLLFFLDIEFGIIEKVGPRIQTASERVLNDFASPSSAEQETP